ncbi:uncharacterized protein METZ01_LOCUS128842 [marine metagenome]|uniref:Uncharacterized protein n=1 Tax=marine metagenome TaxID=408172 RepID=A0A381YFX5_9ZZZZ
MDSNQDYHLVSYFVYRSVSKAIASTRATPQLHKTLQVV